MISTDDSASPQRPASRSGDERRDATPSFSTATPSLALPAGGGAVRGLGEKLSTQAATGAVTLQVPIAAPEGRGGFGPRLALSYDSAGGQGPFGLGWSLGLPAITRRTDRGLPLYQDASETDVFVLAGAEDLVPAGARDAQGDWRLDAEGNLVVDEHDRDGYRVRRYRPRVESAFAWIERWTRLADGDTHWRTLSRDDVLTVFGENDATRIVDPAPPGPGRAPRVFCWLVSRSHDDKGNAIFYDYAAEDASGVDTARPSELSRTRTAQRYLRRIRYGNRQPLLVDASLPSRRPSHLPAPDPDATGWLFELVFDYGEGRYAEAAPDADGRVFATATLDPPSGATWSARADAFSTFRAGFEVRTHRLCRRVLAFHHLPEALGTDDCLVRATSFTYDERATGTRLVQVEQAGFKRQADGRYLAAKMPPLEFGYAPSPLEEGTWPSLPVQELDAASLRRLPGGIDLSAWRWTDLDGEGIAGVLAEQGTSWFYQRNLGEGRFAPAGAVSPRPVATLAEGSHRLVDLEGDGRLGLAAFDGPAPGYFARDERAGWEPFQPFAGLPTLDWRDPDLRFVDLTGDGRADVLITRDHACTIWHPSEGAAGFGPARRVALPWDEESGPRVVFADGTQSIQLADMTGDGLSDLVRIRRGEVCYWPNLGYGRFGPKVTLDGVTSFDDAAGFAPDRVLLADTDGSGCADLLYRGRDGVRVYLNERGNGLSPPRTLSTMPRADRLGTVAVVDLLGRGTMCLLWSTPLPGQAGRTVRYLDLMGGTRPHLMVSVNNHLGARTLLEYASSTRFYLADRAAGRPWATRLPFPVHVLARKETQDLIGGHRFVTRFAYHHGYYDGAEHEFRGFARVDQWDTEDYDAIDATGAPVPPATPGVIARAPVLTRTWYHTGAWRAGERISRALAGEYYREGDPRDGEGALDDAGFASQLLADTPLPDGLDVADRAEAVRALKGRLLRQEVYALDGSDAAARPYIATERNYEVVPMQPRGGLRHPVFFVHDRESVEFRYERTLRPVKAGRIVDAATAAADPAVVWRCDPRVTQTQVLDVDDFGNVRKSLTIAHGRRYADDASPMTDADRALQQQALVTLAEADFTTPVSAPDAFRTPLPAETRRYELVQFPEAYEALAGPPPVSPDVTPLLDLDLVKTLLAGPADGALDLAPEDVDATGATQAGRLYRRLTQCVRTTYRSDDLTHLLPPGSLEVFALPGGRDELVFTPGLLAGAFQRPKSGGGTEALLPDPQAVLPASPGANDRGGYVDLDGDGRWWAPSGRVAYHPDPAATPAQELAEALAHFFVVRRARDPFSNDTFIDFDLDLLPRRTQDAAGNVVVAQNDWRVLMPALVTDANGNRAFAAFDALGLPVATARCGKVAESIGDDLGSFGDFDADPTLAALQAFAADPIASAPALLKGATTRFVVDLDRFRRCGQPPFIATLARETHLSDLAPGAQSPVQVSLAFSDGFGRVLQAKSRVAPGPAPQRAAPVAGPGGDTVPGPLLRDGGGALQVGPADPRWVGSGRTVYDDKGRPVRRYEPFFSTTPLYEPEPEMTDTGVSPVLLRDPLGRVVATLLPHHAWEKRVVDPWSEASWDVNDTVLVADPSADADVGALFQPLPPGDYLPTWHARRIGGALGPDEQVAAQRAAAHAGTPTRAFLDPLGRTFLTIADNGPGGLLPARVRLDIDGRVREMRDAVVQAGDAQGRLVSRTDRDLRGRPVHQASLDAGERWSLADIGDQPLRAWDARGHAFRSSSDALRRPLDRFVIGTGPDADPRTVGAEVCFESRRYGEGLPGDQAANLRTRLASHGDPVGLLTIQAYDFDGNAVRTSRKLPEDVEALPDWAGAGEVFTSAAWFDALQRPVQRLAPASDRPGTTFHVLRPAYDEGGRLVTVDAWLSQPAAPATLLDPATATSRLVAGVAYDARGQRASLSLGNGTTTTHLHDPETFRLVRLTTSAGGRTFQDLQFVFDPAGHVSHLQDDAQQPLYFGGAVARPSSDFVYDAVYRLVAADGREYFQQAGAPEPGRFDDAPRVGLALPGNPAAMRGYCEEYAYDAAGNLATLTHHAGSVPASGGTFGPVLWSRAASFASPSPLEAGKTGNRMTGSQVGALVEAYAFDAHGNTTSLPHLSAMAWDFRDRLRLTSRQVVNDLPPPATLPETTWYAVDAADQRVRKLTRRQNGTRKEERICLDGFEIHRRYGSNGQDLVLERQTLHVDDGRQRVALVEMRTAGDDGSPARLVRYQYGNHLGSATLELSDTAAVISYEEYAPYGGTSWQANDRTLRAAAKRYRFSARERDEESGLCSHGARYYAPWLSRWLSSDPMGPEGGSANLYLYCRGDPANRHDAGGRQDEDSTGGYKLPSLFDKRSAEERLRDRVIADVGAKWDAQRRASSGGPFFVPGGSFTGAGLPGVPGVGPLPPSGPAASTGSALPGVDVVSGGGPVPAPGAGGVDPAALSPDPPPADKGDDDDATKKKSALDKFRPGWQPKLELIGSSLLKPRDWLANDIAFGFGLDYKTQSLSTHTFGVGVLSGDSGLNVPKYDTLPKDSPYYAFDYSEPGNPNPGRPDPGVSYRLEPDPSVGVYYNYQRAGSPTQFRVTAGFSPDFTSLSPKIGAMASYIPYSTAFKHAAGDLGSAADLGLSLFGNYNKQLDAGLYIGLRAALLFY